MKWLLKDCASLNGYLVTSPIPTVAYINDLILRSRKEDTESAYMLFKISRMDAPSYTAPVKASISIGSGDNGVVEVTADIAHASGNDLTLEVVVSAEANAPLSATFVDNAIVVTLGTGVTEGVVDDAKNTALLVEGVINGIADKIFTATASGTGETAIPSAVAEANFTGGVDEVLTELRKAYNMAVASISEFFE